MNIVLGRARPR